MADQQHQPNSADWAELDDAVEIRYSGLGAGYRSPLVTQITENRLTLELLSHHIPLIRQGDEAARLLGVKSGNRSDRRVEELVNARRQGARSKEVLFAAALPLIRALAGKEWRRRKQWGSQALIEDLIQEASVGFMKGLAAFRVDAMKTSPTNYLGQWMLVEMRRSSEAMDHDMQVGHDAGERFRKIRALRSRLAIDLGREPTDQEISDASRNPDYLTRPSMLGRVPEAGRQQARGVSVDQVADERQARSNVGFMARFDAAESNEASSQQRGAVVAPDRAVVAEQHSSQADPAELVTQTATARTLASLLSESLDRMQVAEEQRDIIARRYQLAPYEDDCSVREIARRTGIHRERVTRILNAFTYELTTPGGHFHALCQKMPAGTLEAMGYVWIEEALGEWPPGVATPRTPSRILTESRK